MSTRFSSHAGRAFALSLFALALPAQADSGPSGLPDEPTFTTLAGSGALGISDGGASSATFVSPTGLAYDASGRLYVADRDGQRIRMIARDGTVTTVAGSGALVPLGIGVPGGYWDGEAAEAQFHRPEAVLPRADGSLLIADAGNHCIRLLRGGRVTTFAGSTVAGARDGAATVATFTEPRSLAADTAGNVYIADPPNGVRRIARDGATTTLTFANSRAVVALAFTTDGAHPALLVATARAIERVELTSGAVSMTFPLEFNFVTPTLREGGVPAGPASAIAAFAPADFVFSDPLASTIRHGQSNAAGGNTVRSLTADPLEDAALRGGGYRDGPGESALVREPMGLAIAPDGTVAVADTANRRVRIMSRFEHLTHQTVDSAKTELPGKPDPHTYRIALVGNSYIWTNQTWHASIGGATQDLLAAKLPQARTPRVYPIMRQGAPPLAITELVENELSDGLFDFVVLDLPTYGQFMSDTEIAAAFPDGWPAKLTAALARVAAKMRRLHVPLLVLLHPGAADFPTEMAYRHLPKGVPEEHPFSVPFRDARDIERYHDLTAAAVAAAGVDELDLWPAFLTAYRGPDAPMFFGAWDHHLTLVGRMTVAKSLAQEIRRVLGTHASIR